VTLFDLSGKKAFITGASRGIGQEIAIAFAEAGADLALATGRVDEAIGRYTTAIEMNARIGARPFLALSRLGLAKALVARGVDRDLPAARALVGAAAAEFRRLDLPGPLAAADALLTRIDAAANAANPLSRRESEVASLIALAMSNRQIADELVISPATAARHVANILAKLGFTSRTQVASWAARHEPSS